MKYAVYIPLQCFCGLQTNRKTNPIIVQLTYGCVHVYTVEVMKLCVCVCVFDSDVGHEQYIATYDNVITFLRSVMAYAWPLISPQSSSFSGASPSDNYRG